MTTDKIKHAEKRLAQFCAAYKAVENGPDYQMDHGCTVPVMVSRAALLSDKAVCVRHAAKVLAGLLGED